MSTSASGTDIAPKIAENAKVIEPLNYSESTKKGGIIILIILAMFAIILIVVYIVNMVKKSSMKNIEVVNKVIPLDNRQIIPYKIPGSALEATMRGQEFSYSYWVYLSSQYDATANHKLIMARNNTEGEYNVFTPEANPIIFMHRSTNVMYFALSTTEVKTRDNTFASIISKNANGQFTSKYLVSHIDYVPLQRWAHIVMSVRDASMTIYMDGDIYSVVNVADIPWEGSNVRPIIRSTQSDAVIGDPQNPAKGFLSKMEFFNYALSQDDCKDIYKQGPIKQTFFGKLGLGNYGVRTPVYKIEAAAKNV